MSTTSIVMMVVSMLILWGGLCLSIVLLLRSDARQRGSADPGPGARPGSGHLTRDL